MNEAPSLPRGAPPSDPEPISDSLSWALSRLLPGREETWLLRSLLHRGPGAQEAWGAFTGRIEDLPSLFRTDSGGRKRLSPLLLRAIRESSLPADPGLLTVLRTAALREELRAGAYRKIAGLAYTALRNKGIRFLVLKGAALSETAYPEPSLRHAHDIDLLLPPDEVEEAGAALSELGLRRDSSGREVWGLSFRHRSDLPVLLLTRLFRHRFYQADFETLWTRSRQVALGPVPGLRIMSPEDNLLHALGHASYSPSRSTLSWVTDAWMILRGSAEVDWNVFVGQVVESGLELPVFVMARYLKEALGAPIPREAHESLAAGAGRAGKLKRDIALYGARQVRSKHPDLSSLARPGWRERANLLLWKLLPSREYIEWAYPGCPKPLTPAIYVLRPFSFAAERLKWRTVRLFRSVTGT